MKHWFSSDHHFYHKNIINLCERPYDSLIDMHEALIENHNSLVSENDMVFLLGDLCFHSKEEQTKSIVDRLNGIKHFIIGNHDKNPYHKDFKILSQYKELSIEGQKITLCHYPQVEWNGSYRGSWCLHGHSHGNYIPPKGKLILDVGVDCHNYRPIEFNQIKEIMRRKGDGNNLS